MTGQLRRGEGFFRESGVAGFTHRAFTKSMGLDDDDLRRPLIGICNTFSELNNCHRHFRELCEAVKRGVLQAGGTPLEFPTISLGEIFLSPTSMLHRNLAAMDTEEMIRSQPLDGVVLLASCDKTTPAALMGAASADLPAILVSGGPMLNGNFRGETLGACTDCRRLTAEHRAGTLDDATYQAIEDGIVRSAGHCMVMGTASTMNSLTEALGVALPGNGAIPAVDSRRMRLAQAAGRRIVAMVSEGLRPSRILTRAAFENAIVLLSALGGSTNAVVHLPAIAGRCGVELPLELFDEISARTPLLANLRPVGAYQMEELFYAGGIPSVLRELLPLLHGDQLTVTGRTLAENVATAEPADGQVIRPLSDPLQDHGGLAILRGNLAPDGAVIKHAAASPELLRHRGRALVFTDLHDLRRRIDDLELDVRVDDILVLQNAGPLGGPGMPEVGNFPIPRRLLQQGVRDMVRISDARMSGTAYGTIVLHVAPESAAGGPLAFVRTGDEIELDVERRRLQLCVDDAELARRRAAWRPPAPAYARGYGRLFLDHVQQAPLGCDFDFLRGRDPVRLDDQAKF
ncbi:IlvD/Edd family dehydratase [Actinopolymorpha alba]|uniref:IlvD/Edd family dehydratase n=1 Tax=Actinopolymorpha alba TaxID=533267 RepID=UPI000381536F|nr:IlvD/Edd family dehydratase [Actinopolymorpha alba]